MPLWYNGSTIARLAISLGSNPRRGTKLWVSIKAMCLPVKQKEVGSIPTPTAIFWATSIKVMLSAFTRKNTDQYRGSPPCIEWLFTYKYSPGIVSGEYWRK